MASSLGAHPGGDAVERAFVDLIKAAEPNTSDREGLRATKGRAARAWAELTEGYGPTPRLTTFEAESDVMVVERAIPFFSLCEHHLLPFFGTVAIAYLPDQRILGLSKFSRLVRHHSRRLQVQERLTSMIADTLEETLEPAGVFVQIKAQHLCMQMRGIETLGSDTVTTVARGAMRTNPTTKAEAMEMLR